MVVARSGLHFNNIWLPAQIIPHIYLLPAVKYTIGDSFILDKLLCLQVAKTERAYIVLKWQQIKQCFGIFLFICPHSHSSISAVIHKVAEIASTTYSKSVGHIINQDSG